VQLKPKVHTFSGTDVEHYLRAIHATDAVRDEWANLGKTEWRELTAVALKTFVRVGEPAVGSKPWRERTHQGLEIVPVEDPTRLKPDQAFAVTVFRGDEPAKDCVVSFLSSGENREHVVLTDENGRASATLDAAGPWLIESTDIVRTKAEDHDWRADVAAITVTTAP
jgi:uncharacterized GH25 family protein